MKETIVTSTSLVKYVYFILVNSIRNIPVTATDIRHSSAEDSVIRKAIKFVKTKWASSSLKGDLLDLFNCCKVLSIVESFLMFNEMVALSASIADEKIDYFPHLCTAYAPVGVERMTSLQKAR